MDEKLFQKRILHLLSGALALTACVAVFYILAQIGIGIPCVFYEVTGLQCPGCGNSRAALALLRLDLPAAIGYNPLFPLEYGYILWVLFHCSRSYLKGKRFAYKTRYPIWDIAVLAAVLVWGILRNLI